MKSETMLCLLKAMVLEKDQNLITAFIIFNNLMIIFINVYINLIENY